MRKPHRSLSPDSALRARARLGSVALLAALLIPLAPTPALAAATCSFNSTTNVLEINLGDDDLASLNRQGTNIRLQAPGPVTVACTGGQPTVANTDDINITGSAGNNTLFIQLHRGFFAPGATDEPGGSDEIEITVDLLGGSDNFFLSGAPGERAMNLRAGALGLNLNASERSGVDADLTVAGEPYFQVSGNSDVLNVISGAGGAGTGGPFPAALDIRGLPRSAETLIGGAANDFIFAGDGNDLVAGGGGGDVIKGEGGRDTVTYKGTGGATLDLATGVASDDGTGASDSLTGVENVTGSANRDDLTGSDRKNKIVGGGGRDLLFGMGNDDRLLGKGGRDQLQGETGDDYLHGGRGRRDLCIGGPGADRLRSCELR